MFSRVMVCMVLMSGLALAENVPPPNKLPQLNKQPTWKSTAEQPAWQQGVNQRVHQNDVKTNPTPVSSPRKQMIKVKLIERANHLGNKSDDFHNRGLQNKDGSLTNNSGFGRMHRSRSRRHHNPYYKYWYRRARGRLFLASFPSGLARQGEDCIQP